MTKQYIITCNAHAKAFFDVEARDEEHAEELLDEWLKDNSAADLDWEVEYINTIDIDEI